MGDPKLVQISSQNAEYKCNVMEWAGEGIDASGFIKKVTDRIEADEAIEPWETFDDD